MVYITYITIVNGGYVHQLIASTGAPSCMEHEIRWSPTNTRSLAYDMVSLRGLSYGTKTCKSGCLFGVICKGFLSSGTTLVSSFPSGTRLLVFQLRQVAPYGDSGQSSGLTSAWFAGFFIGFTVSHKYFLDVPDWYQHVFVADGFVSKLVWEITHIIYLYIHV